MKTELAAKILAETKAGAIAWKQPFAGDYTADWQERELLYRFLRDEPPTLFVLDCDSHEVLVELKGYGDLELRRSLSLLGSEIDEQLDRPSRSPVPVPDKKPPEEDQLAEISRLVG